MRIAIHTAVILRGEVSGVMNHSVCQRCAGRDGAKPAYLGLPREGPGKRLVHQGRPVRSCSYSIFELSVNTISGAPSFVRSLRKGWETTDILRNCKHPGRKRSSASANKYQQPLGAPSGRPPGTTSLFLWLGWGSTKTVFICRISNEKLAVPRALLRCE